MYGGTATSTSTPTSTSSVTLAGDWPGLILEIAFTTNPGDPPVWEDVTDYVRSASTNRGKDSELDQDQPGTMSVVLNNNDRRFDPTYSSGPYFGDILPMRRIRLRAAWNGIWDPIFSGYIESWPQSWPDRLFQSDVSIQAVDGFKPLTLKAQPATDPSEDSYPDVISYDEPSFYYRLGEPAGTKVVHHVRKKKRKHETRHHYNHHKRRSEIVTAAEVEGISGPAGTYKNTPTLGQPGIIAGDADTCVLFQAANSEYARIGPLDASDVVEGTSIAIEAWINFASLHGSRNSNIVAGPFRTSDAVEVWYLAVDSTGNLVLSVDGAERVASTTTLSANTWYHVYADSGPAVSGDPSNTGAVYINGVLDNQTVTGNVPLAAGDADEFIRIGGAASGTSNSTYWDGYLDEVAVYEHRLSAARVLAHYEAGLRGYDQDTTGNRIADVLSTADLGFDTSIRSGAREVIPVRQSGQSSTEPVDEAVAAEGGPARFFFAADLTATFLDRDHRTIAPWSSSRATFGDDGTDLPYEDITISYDESFLFNQIRIEASGGTMQEVEDTTSQGSFMTRTLERTGVPMVSDSDALDEATDLLARFKDPIQRITGVTFQLGAGTDALYSDMQAAVLERELGDYITVTRRPLGGDAITQSSYIERISHSIDFEARTWQTTFAVSPK